VTLRALISEARETAKHYPRLFAGVLLLTALIFSIRLVADFWVHRSDSLRVFEAPEVKAYPGSASKQWLLEKIDRWFPATATNSGVAQVVERQILLQAIYGERKQLNAVFILKGEGTPDERVTLVIGQMVEGWTVKAVQRKRVIMSKGDQARELVLFPAKSGSG